MDPRSALADLVGDRSRGAAEITRRARSALARLPDAADDAAGEAREAVLALLEAHPSMAPVVHLADETLTRLDREGPAGLRELPREPSPTEAVAEQTGPGLREADRVLTYSRSGTVIAALERALADHELTVVTSEARPGREGLSLARQLHEAGAEVELTYDAHLGNLAGEADLVLVGADAIAADAFVNKTGTRSLLQEAQRAGTPAWVLASSDKLWPAALGRAPRTRVQADWHPDVPDQIDVQAPLFEQVPLARADRIVTEDGPREPEELAQRVEEADIHPDVVAAVERG